MAIASALSFSFSRVCNECRETQKRKSQTLVTRQQYIFIYIKLFEILNRSVDVLERACQHFQKLFDPTLSSERDKIDETRACVYSKYTAVFPWTKQSTRQCLGSEGVQKKRMLTFISSMRSYENVQFVKLPMKDFCKILARETYWFSTVTTYRLF